MSPRAACRLEHLGFTDVYDYVPGKVDWMAAGLPREGESSRIPYAGDLADHHVPTCGRRESLGSIQQALGEHGICVAVTDGNVVLGMLYESDLHRQSAEASVEQAMHPGPATVRANEPVEPLVQRMRQADVDGILVTAPEGRLIGLFNRHRTEGIPTGTAQR